MIISFTNELRVRPLLSPTPRQTDLLQHSLKKFVDGAHGKGTTLAVIQGHADQRWVGTIGLPGLVAVSMAGSSKRCGPGATGQWEQVRFHVSNRVAADLGGHGPSCCRALATGGGQRIGINWSEVGGRDRKPSQPLGPRRIGRFLHQ